METKDAVRQARELMNAHGLDGWVFELDRARRRAGQCRHHDRVISLSEAFVRLNDESHVIDTILHEIAHALVGPNHGHNPTWRRQARAIGCTGERCYSESVVMPEKAFIGRCVVCGIEVKRDRRRRGALHARDRGAIVWRRNPAA